ncbi:MAG: type II toxin-antitoxin system RelE/ParE family toxin [Bacteroidetes bacterium]|nr:type II toxin-antitoxin system RelE/ParE family toxin [Bacteroidota bacterium]
MAKRLVVSRKAYLDIDRIVEFNNQRNQSTRYSKKFVRSLFREFDKLKKFPAMGIVTGRENTFLLIWDQYHIYYNITDSTVEINSLFHQKENVTR